MNKHPMICLAGSALILYFLAALLYSGGLYSRRRFHGRFATLLTGLGFTCHTVLLGVYLWIHHSFLDLFSSLSGTFFVFGWALIGTQLWMDWKHQMKALGAVALPLGVLSLLLGLTFPTKSTPMIAHLIQHPSVITTHIIAILAGYVSFTVAFCAAMIYLIQDQRLKQKKVVGLMERLPSLNRSDTLALQMVAIGFPLMTLGLALGIFAAEIRVGHAWILDPKAIASILVWLIYGVYLTSRFAFGWAGKKIHYFLIVGFLLMILTYAGGLIWGPHGTKFIH